MTTIKISRNRLLSTLLRLRHVFLKKNALPILDDYLFVIDGNELTVTSCNGEIFASETLLLPDGAITHDGEERLRWCVYRGNILPALKTLDEQEITIRVMEYQVSFTHDCGKFSVPIDDANEFPTCEYFVSKHLIHHIKLEAPGVAHWLDVLYSAMADDELRPVMNGIVLDFTPDALCIVASDGHRLIRIRKESMKSDGNFQLIIPKKVVNILRSVLPKTGHVDLFFNEYRHEDENPDRADASMDIELDDGHHLYISFRGIEGRYPNYGSVIPDNHSLLFSVNRQQLIRSLERATLFSNCSSNLGVLNVTDENKLIISSSDKDFEISSDETIPCDVREDGVKLPFGVRISTLIQCLKKLSAKNVIFKMIDSSRPIIFEPEPQPDVEDITVLIMPMLLSD